MFNLNSEITIANLITFLSVLITLLAFLRKWRSERQLRHREIAIPIRQASNDLKTKLQRWERHNQIFFTMIQPILSEADELFTQQGNRLAARDILWIELFKKYGEYQLAINNENIEEAGNIVIGVFPEIQPDIEKIFNLLKTIDEISFHSLLNTTQKKTLMVADGIPPATLSNTLRDIVAQIQAVNSELFANSLILFEEFYEAILRTNDSHLAEGKVLFERHKSYLYDLILKELQQLALLINEHQRQELIQAAPHLTDTNILFHHFLCKIPSTSRLMLTSRINQSEPDIPIRNIPFSRKALQILYTSGTESNKQHGTEKVSNNIQPRNTFLPRLKRHKKQTATHKRQNILHRKNMQRRSKK